MEPNYMRKTTLLKADPMSYNVVVALTAILSPRGERGAAPQTALFARTGLEVHVVGQRPLRNF